MAHVQGSLNVLRKQTGRRTRWMLGFTALLLGVVFVLPLLGAAGIVGYFGARAARAEVDIGLSVGLFTYVFLFGLTAGLGSGSRRLSWESLAVFPVSQRTLFIDELCAGALDLNMLFPLLGLLILCVSACAANPVATPIYLYLFVTHGLLLLALQMLGGSITQRLSRSLRTSLLLLPLLAVSVLALGPLLLAEGKRAFATTLLRIGARIVALSPAHAQLTAARRLLHGTLTGDVLLGAIVGPLVLVLATLLGTFWLVVREHANVAESERKPARLWTFSRPTWGVARLQWTLLLRSLPGRVALVMPLMAISLVRLPWVARDPAWAVAAAFIYSALAINALLSNQFGLDRHGVKVLLLLPIDARTLLVGKQLGFAAWQALQTSILCGLLAVFAGATAFETALGIACSGCLFMAMVTLGTRLSLWQPLPLGSHGARAGPHPVLFGFLIFVVPVLAGGVPYASLLVANLWLPGWELGLLVLLFAVLLALDLLVLPLNARYLERGRERIVEWLSATG